MTRSLRFVFPVLAASLAAAVFFMLGVVAWGIASSVVGAVWVICLMLGKDRGAGIGLMGIYGLSAAGILFLPAEKQGIFTNGLQLLLLAATILALCGWDLAAFHARLRKANAQDDTRPLEVRHVARLCLPALGGMLLAGGALLLNLKPGFEWVLIMMILMAWGIGRLASGLMNRNG